nr:TPA_inf: a3.1 [Pseudozyma hubeiensis]
MFAIFEIVPVSVAEREETPCNNGNGQPGNYCLIA